MPETARHRPASGRLKILAVAATCGALGGASGCAKAPAPPPPAVRQADAPALESAQRPPAVDAAALAAPEPMDRLDAPLGAAEVAVGKLARIGTFDVRVQGFALVDDPAPNRSLLRVRLLARNIGAQPEELPLSDHHLFVDRGVGSDPGGGLLRAVTAQLTPRRALPPQQSVRVEATFAVAEATTASQAGRWTLVLGDPNYSQVARVPLGDVGVLRDLMPREVPLHLELVNGDVTFAVTGGQLRYADGNQLLGQGAVKLALLGTATAVRAGPLKGYGLHLTLPDGMVVDGDGGRDLGAGEVWPQAVVEFLIREPVAGRYAVRWDLHGPGVEPNAAFSLP